MATETITVSSDRKEQNLKKCDWNTTDSICDQNPLGKNTFDFISCDPAGCDAHAKFFGFSLWNSQNDAVDLQKQNCHGPSNPFVSINESVGLRKVVDIS